MTREKIAVSLPGELVSAAKRAVSEGRAPSVSAYVEAALQAKVASDDLRAFLDELLAQTGGPLSREERREADRILGREKAKGR